jgi:poly(3-hydroxybutyrate) depolymerase
MVPASAITKGNWLLPRSYWVWLPTNYDKTHAYPVIFVGPGCGGKGNNSIQPQVATGNDAIIVGLDYNSMATGRDCFMTEAFPDPETEYVENTVKLVDAAFCVDKSRRFIEGFSSGSWLAYLMGCVDGGPGGLFKGQGNATGNWQGSLPDSACKGPIAWMGAHNMPDPQSYNAYPGGRDHVLKENGCTSPPVTTKYDPGPNVKPPATPTGVAIDCEQYMGCKVPTVFCTTTGPLGHNDQQATGISTYGMWRFWMSLP